MTQAVANQAASVLPERLTELREKAGLSQRELAKVIGIDPSVPRLWEKGAREKGARKMPERWVPAVAKALGVSVVHLFASTDAEWAAAIAEAEARELSEHDAAFEAVREPSQEIKMSVGGIPWTESDQGSRNDKRLREALARSELADSVKVLTPDESLKANRRQIVQDFDVPPTEIEHITRGDVLAVYDLTPAEIGLESTDPLKMKAKPKRTRRSKAEIEAAEDKIDLAESRKALAESDGKRTAWDDLKAEMLATPHAAKAKTEMNFYPETITRSPVPLVPVNGHDDDESSAAMAREEHQFGVHTETGMWLTTYEAGIRLGREHSRVRRFAEEGRIPGAMLKAQGKGKRGGLWLLPDWGVKKFAALQRPNGYPRGRPRGPRPPRKPKVRTFLDPT